MDKNIDYKKDLAEKLEELKKIEGFPIGTDEDILALSKPPYYTACPNPYIKDFIEEHGKPYNEETDDYHRVSYEGDIEVGKNSSIYNSHAYHTKVPPEAITNLINYFTSENDIVLDGFCGSGMTGVASTLNKRNVVISDLSPIATQISYNYIAETDKLQVRNDFNKILLELKEEFGYFFETYYNGKKGEIINIVWSDVNICKFCNNEFLHSEAEKKDNYCCPNCNAELKTSDYQRVFIKKYDDILNEEIEIAKQAPIKINLRLNKKRIEKNVEEFDIKLINKIDELSIPYKIPIYKLPRGFNTKQPISSHKFTHFHHFYWRRNLILIAGFFEKAKKYETKNFLFYIMTSAINNLSKRYRFRTTGGGGPSGNLYIPSLSRELNFFFSIKDKFKSIYYNNPTGNYIVSTQSCSDLKNIEDNSIDYIFTDPPFGANIMYNELNFMIEVWLKCFTNSNYDAIINNEQSKPIDFYEKKLTTSFEEYYRVLKPKRWINIEFNNSKSIIWNILRKSINKSGFIISQVSVLDKKQGSFKQVTSPGSVSKDLLISAFKPTVNYSDRNSKVITKEVVNSFINDLLNHIKPTIISERTFQMLYSKYISLCMTNNYSIDFDASAFSKFLFSNFTEKDGLWFTQNQVDVYLEFKKKMKLEGIEDIKTGSSLLFVNDEKSALVWLYNFLSNAQSYSEISIAFNQLPSIEDDEVPELKEILEQNFITEGGKYRRPHGEAEHNSIAEKRQKSLSREFETLLVEAQTQKGKIKLVRKEALAYGFELCYKEKRFADILIIAKKLDKKILENSGELNDFVEAAEIMIEGIS
ncbi:MAG: DNA methyltransferase [Bacteroidales bacterium]